MIRKYITLIILTVVLVMVSLFWQYWQTNAAQTEGLSFSRIWLATSTPMPLARLSFVPDRLFARYGRLFVPNTTHKQMHVYSVQGKQLPALCEQIQLYPLVNISLYQHTLSVLDPRSLHWYQLAGQGVVRKDTVPLVFSRGIELDSAHLLVKGSRQVLGAESFYLYSLTDKSLTEQKNIIPLVEDAGMTTDGIFIKNTSTGEIFFMMYLKGQFLCFDASGKFRYAASTVDGFDKAYKLARSASGITFRQPTRMLNVDACSSGGYVYILSRVASKEDPAQKSVVDVYLAQNGNYVGSYALAGGISSIAVEGNYLYAVQGKMIIRYELSPVAKSI